MDLLLQANLGVSTEQEIITQVQSLKRENATTRTITSMVIMCQNQIYWTQPKTTSLSVILYKALNKA